MFALRKYLFLTLVQIFLNAILLSSAHANPHYDSPSRMRPDENVDTPPRGEVEENVAVGKASAGPTRLDEWAASWSTRNYYYAFRQEIDLHAGVVFGFQDSSDDKDLMNGLLGFSYLAPSLKPRRWAFGVDLAMMGYGHFYAVQRKIFNEKGPVRPYYDIGVMQKFVPEEKMASWSNWENYLLRIGIGAGMLLTPPKSAKLDLSVAVGTKDVLVMFTYGQGWGF